MAKRDSRTERHKGHYTDGSFDVEAAIVDLAPVALVCVDADGVITLVNRQVERMFGYDRRELIGERIEMLVPPSSRQHHPEDRASYGDDPSRRPMGASRGLAAVRKDGSEFPVEIGLSSFSADGQTLVVAAVTDMKERLEMDSERSDLEVQLLRSQRDEERSVLEAQLLQAQRLETVGQLAAGVAHDFNNLLAGIMNYSTLVSHGVKDLAARQGLDDDLGVTEIVQDIDEIIRVAQRGSQLTRQLLIFSRRGMVEPEVLDLNAVVTDMEKLLRRTIGESIDLGSKLDPDVPLVEIDPGQLEQVIMNLVVNARDAMPQGGLVRIETSLFKVDADYAAQSVVKPGSFARLTVADSGVGMKPEERARAMEPFYTTKEKGKGSGLGLATVYGIVTQVGGEITLYSEQGLGTTVRVLLPIAGTQEVVRESETEFDPIGVADETILLVEDEDIVREPTKRMLERQGYTVLAACDAEEAVKQSTAHNGVIDLLLTDVVMPGRSGKELATELHGLRPSTKVLYMSGYGQDVIVHQGVLDEGVTLIEKPFAAEDLLRLIRQVIQEPQAACLPA